jgi:competence ComEA-like helix-hairpin-helix protein
MSCTMRARERDERMETEAFRIRRACTRAILLAICVLFSLVAAHAKKKPPSSPLDLNTATIDQLQQLPGVGPAAAQAIVNFRTKSGPFQRVEDLLAIRGISQRKFEALRSYVMVRAASPAAQAPKKNLGLSVPTGAAADGASCD